MQPLDERSSRRILEVADDASMDEVARAYHLLKRVHGRDLAVSAAPGMEEFSVEARHGILEQIEAAYRLLAGLGAGLGTPVPARAQRTEDARASSPEDAQASSPEGARGGARTVLGLAREAAGVSLDQVAAETHVRKEYLAALEQEDFENLRLAPVNLRGYLTAFVNALGLSVEELVPRYMASYAQWQVRHRS
jgi:hypothetical protein